MKPKMSQSWDKTKDVVQSWVNELNNLDKDFISADEFSEILNTIKAKCEVKGKELFYAD